jgi:8-oxo-dGTP pyrophosphatase MutT (NUDIX family)
VADPLGARDELVAGCRGGPAAAGHVCATNWVLHPPSRRIVLVAHRTLGWAACGGHVEAGEAPLAAAVRELREETGLDAAALVALPDPLVVHRTTLGGDRPHTHWNLAFGWIAAEPAPLTGEPGAPARWFAVDALPARRPEDVDAVVEVLLDAARRRDAGC